MVRGDPSYCPYCGSELGTRQFEGRDRAHCGDCDRFVWRDTPVVAAVAVVDPDDGVFLQRRAVQPGEGNWGFPAGFLDYGERPRAGAARELREETGLVVDPGDLSAFDTFLVGDRDRAHLWLLYAVPRSAVRGAIDLGEEADRAGYFTPEEFERAGKPMSDPFRGPFERVARWS